MHKILVVDDEPEMVRILESLLTKNDFEVLKALSSEEALKIFASDVRIDLMVLDMRMPKLTGIGILEKMRELKRDIPVLILTGSLDARLYKEDLARLGFSLEDVCYKPIDLFLILDKIRKTKV